MRECLEKGCAMRSHAAGRGDCTAGREEECSRLLLDSFPCLLPVPCVMTTGQLESVCTDRDREELFYKYTSFNDPGTVFKASVKVKPGAPLSIDSKVHFRVNIPGLNPDDFETKQVRLQSLLMHRSTLSHKRKAG